jgi:hypothetical protein
MIYNFCLTIHLWVTSSRKQQLSTQFIPQNSSKISQKFSITIRDNSIRHAMQPNNIRDEQMSNMCSIIGFMTRYEMRHFGEMIDNHKTLSLPLSVLGNHKTKSIEISSQGALGTGRGK